MITRVLGVVLACAVLCPSAHAGGDGVSIDSVTTSRVSIGADPEFASMDIDVAYSATGSPVLLTGELHRDGVRRATIFQSNRVTAVDTLSVTWDGTDLDGLPVADGVYRLLVSAALGDSVALSDSVRVVVDKTAPQVLSIFLTGPQGAYQNGDYVQLRARFDDDPDSLRLEVTADENTDHWATASFLPLGDATYDVLYRISDDNPAPDARGRPINVIVADSLRNESTNNDIVICLSNHPPIFDRLELIDAAGDSVVPGIVYTRGQTVRLRGFVQSPRIPAEAPAVLSFTPDFSRIDTEFNPVTRPATIDTTYALAKEDAPDSLLADGYQSIVAVEISYTLSELNLRLEGTYDVPVEVADNGCGTDPFTPAIRLRLGDLGPPMPTLNGFASEITAAESVRVAGTAPDALRVEVRRNGEAPGIDATLDEVTGDYEATIALDPGENEIVAIAYGPFNHPSAPSPTRRIYRETEERIEINERFRPGDEITVTTFDAPDRIELDVWNLARDLIHHDEALDPGELHAFVWNGRNLDGAEVLSGPYIAQITFHRPSGTSRIARALVFTRK